MGFAGQLFSGQCPVALEITPPRRSLPHVLLRRAGLLGAAASAINVIQRADRQSSLEASLELLAAGLAPAMHLVTRGRSSAEIEREIAAARDGGVDQVLCIRGDHDAPDVPGAPTIRQVVRLVRDAIPGACVGATLNQHARDQGAVLRNLLPKLAAGATYVQTQPVFDLAALRAPVEAIRREAPGTRIVAMVMPLRSPEAAVAIGERLGIVLPAAVTRSLAGEEMAWAAFDAQVAALVASGLADGIAVMTYEMDLPETAGRRLLAALSAAGVMTTS